MKKLWLQYVAKIDALSLRERWLVGAALVLATIAVVYVATVDPAQRRSRTLTAQMESQKEELATMQKVGTAQASDPDSANRTRAEALQAQIRSLDGELTAMQKELVPADQMTTLLQEMLARDAKLTLVSLKTLPAEPLVPAAEKSPRDKVTEAVKPEAANAPVYKHGVEITVQGTYSSLYDYLARLERTAWRMYWWRARLEADDEARLTLAVTVYTLSLDRAWLQV